MPCTRTRNNLDSATNELVPPIEKIPRIESSTAHAAPNQTHGDNDDIPRQQVEEPRRTTDVTLVMLSLIRHTIEETQNKITDYMVRRMTNVVRLLLSSTIRGQC